MRRASLLAVLLAVVTACGESDRRPRTAATATQTPTSAPAPAPEPRRADPEAPIPRHPRAFAADVDATTRALRKAVADWQAGRPGAKARPPAPLMALARRHQRLYARLARRPALRAAVLPRLARAHRREARGLLAARRHLDVLAPTPAQRRRLRIRIGPALPPGVLRSYYDKAHRRFRVDWPTLAAVNFVESSFGRLRNESVAGARGPMQFMPATWAAYGMGGDIRDPHDAIMGAANYLRASGAPRDIAGALYHYNPSSDYVAAVSRYAALIRADPREFVVLWAWSAVPPTGP